MKTIVQQILEASNVFTEKTKARGTVWMSRSKFKGIPVELSNITIDGVTSTDFDHEQVANLLSKGLRWLNSEWSKTYNRIVKDIYEFGKSSWNIPFKSISEMEKYMHLDYVGCHMTCQSANEGYTLDNIKFIIWFNNKYSNMSDEFFGRHSISYQMEFDGNGHAINTDDEWQLEG